MLYEPVLRKFLSSHLINLVRMFVTKFTRKNNKKCNLQLGGKFDCETVLLNEVMNFV